MNRRLTKEMTEIEKEPIEGADVAAVDGDLAHWSAMIEGPEDTPYQGGCFELDLQFPPEYPFKPPKVKFMTRIYHPNVKTEDGEICADVVSDGWGPTLNVRYIISNIRQMMIDPNVESPLE